MHDGSRSSQDKIIFEIEFIPPSRQQLPPHLQLRQRFPFRINVQPRAWSGPPPVSLRSHPTLLRMARGSEKQLEADLFVLADQAKGFGAEDISFHIMTAKKGGGFVKNEHFPSLKLDQFSLPELLNGSIFYVDSGQVAEAELRLQIRSRTTAFTSLVVIQVETFQLRVMMVNNTGLRMPLESSELITSFNLTFTTNAPEQPINIR